jgi:hypothetical protein
MTASKVKYMMDADTILRDTGLAAVVATTNTGSVALDRSSGLEGHVAGMASGRFAVVIMTGARTTGGGEVYTYTVEIDDDSGFATNKKTVATILLDDADTADVRTVLIDDADIDALGDTPAYVRVAMTVSGAGVPSIVFSAFLSPVAAS